MITKYDQYIKESLSTKTDIKNWLDSMNIKKYTINDDLTVDVNGYVNISEKDLIVIPVKFNKVNGSFFCFDNKLTSLKGCPTTITEYFNCYNNQNLKDINDLNSEILIKNIRYIRVSEEVFDKYFEYWINKDFNILEVLKNRVSDKLKQKYSHLFQANKFDLL